MKGTHSHDTHPVKYSRFEEVFLTIAILICINPLSRIRIEYREQIEILQWVGKELVHIRLLFKSAWTGWRRLNCKLLRIILNNKETNMSALDLLFGVKVQVRMPPVRSGVVVRREVVLVKSTTIPFNLTGDIVCITRS